MSQFIGWPTLLSLSSDSDLINATGKLQGYMGAGKPIVVVATGAVADLVEGVDCGLVSQVDHFKKTAENLDYLVKNPGGKWDEMDRIILTISIKAAVIDNILSTLSCLVEN